MHYRRRENSSNNGSSRQRRFVSLPVVFAQFRSASSAILYDVISEHRFLEWVSATARTTDAEDGDGWSKTTWPAYVDLCDYTSESNQPHARLTT